MNIVFKGLGVKNFSVCKLFALSLFLNGCASTTPGNMFAVFGSNTPKLRYMSLKLSDDAKQPGSIYAWDSESNVAYINQDGKTCILAASAARATNLNLKYALSGGSSGEFGKNDSLTKLNDKGQFATALDIVGFHYCMLRINGYADADLSSFKELFSVTASGFSSKDK